MMWTPKTLKVSLILRDGLFPFQYWFWRPGFLKAHHIKSFQNFWTGKSWGIKLFWATWLNDESVTTCAVGCFMRSWPWLKESKHWTVHLLTLCPLSLFQAQCGEADLLSSNENTFILTPWTRHPFTGDTAQQFLKEFFGRFPLISATRRTAVAIWEPPRKPITCRTRGKEKTHQARRFH